MTKVNIKTLSVNKCWQGRRYKTQEYLDYEEYLLLTLPKLAIPQGRLSVSYVIGVSSRASDIDNAIKPFQDILSKKYRFNDNLIYEIKIEKIIVKKGEEFIAFHITNYGFVV